MREAGDRVHIDTLRGRYLFLSQNDEEVWLVDVDGKFVLSVNGSFVYDGWVRS